MMSAARALDVSKLLVFSLAWGIIAVQAHAETVERRDSDPNPGGLLLSPMIRDGELETARRLSRVDLNLNFSVGESYSGYITSNERLRNHLFFWLFMSATNSPAPLLVWLNEGPGMSAMHGLLCQHGPLQLRVMEGGRTVLLPREVHWTDSFSMVYIDTSEGVGLSFTDREDADLSTFHTSDNVAEGLLVFLEQFFRLFPEFENRPLYIGGEGYAGKFVTALAFLIHNKILENRTSLPLHGIFMGAPFIKPEVNIANDVKMMYNIGLVSKGERDQHLALISRYLKQLHDGEFNTTFMEVVNSVYPTQANYIRAFNFASDHANLNLAAISQAVHSLYESIHINQELHFRAFNSDLYNSFVPDLFNNYDDELKVLMERYKVLIYTGDYDFSMTTAGIENIILDMPWTGQDEYRDAYREVWTTGSGQHQELHGYVTAVRQFCRVIVHGAGHFTSQDQPELMLQIISDFVQHGCLRRL